MPPLGALSNKNPWETIQKIMNGQPDSQMPALRAFGLQAGGDVLSCLQTHSLATQSKRFTTGPYPRDSQPASLG